MGNKLACFHLKIYFVEYGIWEAINKDKLSFLNEVKMFWWGENKIAGVYNESSRNR